MSDAVWKMGGMKAKPHIFQAAGNLNGGRKSARSPAGNAAPLRQMLNSPYRADLSRKRPVSTLRFICVPIKPVVAKSQWEEATLLKCPCVADVEHELALCHCAQDAAPDPVRKRAWQARIDFLNQLRAYRASIALTQ